MLAAGRKKIVGIDFDNTIVSYDDVLHDVALSRGLIQADVQKGKNIIRDTVRRLPGGEKEWQLLQAEIYGPSMGQAVLIPGVKDFVRKCNFFCVPMYIVSHKTEFANLDSTNTSLRHSAMNWLDRLGFFGGHDWSISKSQVYFSDSREGKVEVIRSLECTHFVDDLVELYEEPYFPQDVVKILYAPHGARPTPFQFIEVADWNDISRVIFDG